MGAVMTTDKADARSSTLVRIDAREAVIVRLEGGRAHIERVESDVPAHHRATGHVRRRLSESDGQHGRHRDISCQASPR